MTLVEDIANLHVKIALLEQKIYLLEKKNQLELTTNILLEKKIIYLSSLLKK
jgi:hypothetical protein